MFKLIYVCSNRTQVLFMNLFLQNAGQAGCKTYMNRGMS